MSLKSQFSRSLDLFVLRHVIRGFCCKIADNISFNVAISSYSCHSEEKTLSGK